MATKTSDQIRELVETEGDAAEAAETMATAGPDLPEGTTVTRGHGRSKTLQIRLNEDEYEALGYLAKGRDLPLSTMVRSLLLAALAPNDDVGATITRIEGELASLRRVVSQT